MPKSIKLFKNKDKARLYRNRQRRINYTKSRKDSTRSGERWTRDEIYVLKTWVCESDLDLHKLLGRSVQAIQIKRWRLNENLRHSV